MSSTNLIGDAKTVYTNYTSNPNATTQANAIAAAGYIMDYPGNVEQLVIKFEECVNALTRVKTDTDASTDSANLALINKVLALLQGLSTPSTQGITDLNTVYTNGPSSVTTANAIAPAGPILDYPGMVLTAKRLLQEAKVLITAVIYDTAAGDSTNLALLNGITAVLV